MTLKVSEASKFAGLVCLTALLVYFGKAALGIDPADDTTYLRGAASLDAHAFLWHQSWSPLYILYMKGLASIAPDPLFRYFLAWRICVVYLALVPPLLRLPGAWLYTVCLVTLPVLVNGPFVSTFAAAILLTGMCGLLLSRGATFSDACTLAGVLSFLTAFARPEYGYGLFLCLAGLLIAEAFEVFRPTRPDWEKGLRAGVALAKVAVLSVMAWGMQVVQAGSASDNRSGMAFLQHFNLRAVERGLLPSEDFSHSDYAQRVFGLGNGKAFSETGFSIGDYVRANPRLFLHHVLTNLIDYRTVIFVLLAGVLVLRPWTRRGERRLRPASLYLLLMGIPPTASMILIYPRDHYAVVILPCMMIFAVQAYRPDRLFKPSWAGALALAMLLVCCAGATVWKLKRELFRDERTVLARVQCAHDVDLALTDPRAIVVDPHYDLFTYVPHARVPVLPETSSDWSGFRTWAVQSRPVWIASDAGLSDRFGVPRSKVEHFLADDLRYVPHACHSKWTDLVIYTEPAQ